VWIAKLPVAKASVSAVAFAPDGRTIYTGDTAGCLLAWDAGTHECRELYRRPAPAKNGICHLWPVADGSRLLFEGSDGLRDALCPDAGPLLTHPDLRYVTPDGTRAFTCERECRVGLWDVHTGQRLPAPGSLSRAKGITHYQFLPDGTTLLTYCASGYELTLWDFRTGEAIGSLAPNGPGINPCALAPGGTAFAVGRNKIIWVYDVAARTLRHRLRFEKEIRHLAFHPNGRLLASAATDSVVTLWDAAAGAELRRFDWQSAKVEALAFAPDGLTCAVGGRASLGVFDADA
jgi:WD40 repeat protein